MRGRPGTVTPTTEDSVADRAIGRPSRRSAVFSRQVLQDAMVTGHAAILVDHPVATERQTRVQEADLALRPYWVPIKKGAIMSWRTTVARLFFGRMTYRDEPSVSSV